MQKKYFSILSLVLVLSLTISTNAATIINKDDASAFSKKSKYSTILDNEEQAGASLSQDAFSQLSENQKNSSDDSIVTGGNAAERNTSNTGTTNNSGKPKKGAGYVDDSVEVRFSVPKGTKSGNSYSNSWSNYSVSFTDTVYNANEYYDFSSDGVQFDFAVYFRDYSRIAVYYSRLSRDLNTIAEKFAPGETPNDQVIAGEVYKHVTYKEPYPYGTLIYDYYLRNIDNKLMVIECFHEKEGEIAPNYISRFTKKS